MILGHQLYPWTQRELAHRMSEELGLPIDSLRALRDGTMQRLLKWHNNL